MLPHKRELNISVFKSQTEHIRWLFTSNKRANMLLCSALPTVLALHRNSATGTKYNTSTKYQFNRQTCQKKTVCRPHTHRSLSNVLLYIHSTKRRTRHKQHPSVTKSRRLRSTVPPGHCLLCCQQHSIYPDVTAVVLQLPLVVTHTRKRTHTLPINCDVPVH